MGEHNYRASLTACGLDRCTCDHELIADLRAKLDQADAKSDPAGWPRGWCEAVNEYEARERALREALQAVANFARSGWTKDLKYCLVCDEQLSLVAGALKGKRAETFEEITHDPECPIPDVDATLNPPSPKPHVHAADGDCDCYYKKPHSLEGGQK